MHITCWGSRGSIPVSGREYLKYGGDTTCIEILAASGERLVIDAGTGIRRLGNRGVERAALEYHLLLTHVHWDHVMGLPFFRPLYDPRARLIIHPCPYHRESIQKVLTHLMGPPYFPIGYQAIQARIEIPPTCRAPLTIGSLRVSAIPLNHPNNGCGFKIEEAGRSFVFLTDNELGHPHPGGRPIDAYQRFADGADLLIHDAEYTPAEYLDASGWGHSDYTQVVSMARSAGVGRLGLFHINQERTDDQMDRLVADARALMAAEKTEACFGVACGTQIVL